MTATKAQMAGTARTKSVLGDLAEGQFETTYRTFHPFPAQMPLELTKRLIADLTHPNASVFVDHGVGLRATC